MKEKVENKFWIVISNRFPTNVSYKHTSYESTLEESKRLARMNRGTRFTVMESTDSVVLDEVVVTKHVNPSDNPDDPSYIPF